MVPVGMDVPSSHLPADLSTGHFKLGSEISNLILESLVFDAKVLEGLSLSNPRGEQDERHTERDKLADTASQRN